MSDNKESRSAQGKFSYADATRGVRHTVVLKHSLQKEETPHTQEKQENKKFSPTDPALPAVTTSKNNKQDEEEDAKPRRMSSAQLLLEAHRRNDAAQASSKSERPHEIADAPPLENTIVEAATQTQRPSGSSSQQKTWSQITAANIPHSLLHSNRKMDRKSATCNSVQCPKGNYGPKHEAAALEKAKLDKAKAEQNRADQAKVENQASTSSPKSTPNMPVETASEVSSVTPVADSSALAKKGQGDQPKASTQADLTELTTAMLMGDAGGNTSQAPELTREQQEQVKKTKECRLSFIEKLYDPDIRFDLWNNHFFYDLELVCGDARWRVHRDILENESPWFHMNAPLRNPDESPVIWHLPNHQPEQLGAVLEWMYFKDYKNEFLNPDLPIRGDAIVSGTIQFIAGMSVDCQGLMEKAFDALESAVESLKAIMPAYHEKMTPTFWKPLHLALTIMFEQDSIQELCPLRHRMAELVDVCMAYLILNTAFQREWCENWVSLLPLLVSENKMFASAGLLGPPSVSQFEHLARTPSVQRYIHAEADEADKAEGDVEGAAKKGKGKGREKGEEAAASNATKPKSAPKLKKNEMEQQIKELTETATRLLKPGSPMNEAATAKKEAKGKGKEVPSGVPQSEAAQPNNIAIASIKEALKGIDRAEFKAMMEGALQGELGRMGGPASPKSSDVKAGDRTGNAHDASGKDTRIPESFSKDSDEELMAQLKVGLQKISDTPVSDGSRATTVADVRSQDGQGAVEEHTNAGEQNDVGQQGDVGQ